MKSKCLIILRKKTRSRFSAEVIVEYIGSKYEAYLQEELKIVRHMKEFPDTRIHACLYFISPTGHG